MHCGAKSSGKAVVRGKQSTALVLWSHIWGQFEQYIAPRAIERKRSKITTHSLSNPESQRAGLSCIGFQQRVILNV